MIPVSYTVRNIINHKITSALTILGVSLVVFVFAAVLMMSTGLRETLVATGSDDNAIVIRQASLTEVQSIIPRDQADIVKTSPEIAVATDGLPLFTKEIYVLITLLNRHDGDKANVVVRGVSDKSLELRPNATLVEGRMWREGTSEIIAGKSIAERFAGCGLGETVRFGARDWTVVGILDAGGSGFDSELWGDIDQMMDAFRRPVYSSLTFRLADPSSFVALRDRIEDDPRLPLEVKREKEYYADQSRSTAGFVSILGTVVSIVFACAAIVGAMITMFAAVANRTREIGTLRALGFSRLSILNAFLLEAMLIALAGGILGIAAAATLSFVRISMTNWDTFSELAFNFQLTPGIVLRAILFAVVMGFIGGVLPAVRASMKRIVDSLRAV